MIPTLYEVESSVLNDKILTEVLPTDHSDHIIFSTNYSKRETYRIEELFKLVLGEN